jgi:hypothetical protein
MKTITLMPFYDAKILKISFSLKFILQNLIIFANLYRVILKVVSKLYLEKWKSPDEQQVVIIVTF